MKRKVLFQFLLVTLICVLYTLLLKTVDIGYVAATGSTVGFSSVNIPFSERFGFNPVFYKISQVGGYVSFLVIGFFFVMGLYELIKNKSLKKVDGDLYALAITYVFTIILYIFFDKLLVINMRPFIIPGESALESGFPSSHTLLAVVVFGTAIAECGKIKKREIRVALTVLLGFSMLLIVFSRLFSGVHWVTDIIGGILWGEALMELFQVFSFLLRKNRGKQA